MKCISGPSLWSYHPEPSISGRSPQSNSGASAKLLAGGGGGRSRQEQDSEAGTGPQIQADTACGGSGSGPCWSRPSFPMAYFHLSFSASRAFLKQLFRRRRWQRGWEEGSFLHLPPKQAGPEQDAPFPSSLCSLHLQRRKWLGPTTPQCARTPHAPQGSPILGCFNKRQMRASRSSFW